MKMKRILIPVLMFTLGTLLLTACSEEKQMTEPEVNVQKEVKVENQDEKPQMTEDSLEKLRADMEPSAAIAGVFYMGYKEGNLSDEDYHIMVDQGGYGENYGFLTNIPRERMVDTGGGEVYCIVPADPEAMVKVVRWDESNTAGVAGEELYHSETGEPVIIKGNISDIMPDFAVTIEDGYGNRLEQYHPRISLENGLVITPEDPIVLDYTLYDYVNK